MSRPWIAEHEPTPAEARASIRARFPAVAAERVEPFGSGWDNTAFLVDGAFVFRFPRKASAVPLLEAETAVLSALGDRLPLAVPEPRFVASPGDDFPWPFMGYPLLPGETACRAAPSAGRRQAMAPVLGRFLAVLHRVAPEGLGLPGDTLGRLDLRARRGELEERLASLARAGIVPDGGPWGTLFDALDRPTAGRPGARVVHGDLYARHLLVDDEGRLTGVIDWGDVHRGDPAVDLMVAFAFLPAAARPAFFDAYGPVTPDTLALARRRALFHSVAVTWFASEHGDRVLLAEGRRALDHVLEDGPDDLTS